MGTRNITIAIIDDQIKVAQYGQWDGYLSGVGVEIANFIQSQLNTTYLSKQVLGDFKDKLHQVTDISQAQLDLLNDTPFCATKHPELSRDTGGNILSLINQGVRSVNRISLEEDFTGQFDIEYFYVIDFDHDIVQCFDGGYNMLGVFEFKDFTKENLLKLEAEIEARENAA